MIFLFPTVKRLAAIPMPVLMVVLFFGFAAGMAAQAVAGAAAQAVNPVLADATRPVPAHTTTPVAAEQAAPVFFRHPDGTRYFVAGQANIIFQAHGPFHTPYEGTNSLLGRGGTRRR